MKTKLGSISIYVDTASNLIIETESVNVTAIKKAFTQEQIAEGSVGTIIAVIKQLQTVGKEYEFDVAQLIKEC